MRAASQCKAGGFTFLEVILVLLFISIFATVAVLRQPPTDVALQVRSEVLKAHIRYAQGRAMNTDTAWGLRYDDNMNTYWLFSGDNPDDPGNRRLLPGENDTTVRIEQGIVLDHGGFTLSFDTWGRPGSGGSLLSSALPITLSKNGQSTRLTIIPNTGFVQ